MSLTENSILAQLVIHIIARVLNIFQICSKSNGTKKGTSDLFFVLQQKTKSLTIEEFCHTYMSEKICRINFKLKIFKYLRKNSRKEEQKYIKAKIEKKPIIQKLVGSRWYSINVKKE